MGKIVVTNLAEFQMHLQEFTDRGEDLLYRVNATATGQSVVQLPTLGCKFYRPSGTPSLSDKTL